MGRYTNFIKKILVILLVLILNGQSTAFARAGGGGSAGSSGSHHRRSSVSNNPITDIIFWGIIDKWYPSSKTCHVCGEINNELTLADRAWTCSCGTIHHRDMNAAINIRNEGCRMLGIA